MNVGISAYTISEATSVARAGLLDPARISQQRPNRGSIGFDLAAERSEVFPQLVAVGVLVEDVPVWNILEERRGESIIPQGQQDIPRTSRNKTFVDEREKILPCIHLSLLRIHTRSLGCSKQINS
jgi:hypothetical protein